MLRHLWAWSMTEAAEASARRMTYTGLSYAARGLPLEGGEHLGEDRAAMVARGERVWAHEGNRIKAACNAQRLMLRDIDRKMAALTRLRDTLMAEQDMPGTFVRQKLVAAVPEPGQPVPLREAGDSAERPVDLVSAASPRSADLVRPQPLVAADAAPMTPSPAPQSLVAAGGSGRTPETLQPALPALPVSTQAFAEPTALVVAGRHHAGSLPGVLAVARAARTAPPPIVEIMHETLRRLASKRRARPVDPAVTALHRRRALADEADRFAPARVILERSWLDLNPLTPFTTATRQRARDRDRERMTRIAAGGGYVTVQPSGLLIQAVRTAAEPVPTDDWWAQDHVQRPLADLRERQQWLMAQALDLSGLTPDQLMPGRPAGWTIAVSAADRAKLDRWAEAPAFHADLVAVARRLAGEAADWQKQPEMTRGQEGQPPDARAARKSDGLGEPRDTLPPVFTGSMPPVRLAAFDRGTGKPTDHLLRLLALAGKHPHAVTLASDGKLMVIGKAPALLAPLLHGWRDNDRVAALVTETVQASRDAGQPVWPDSIARAVLAYMLGQAETSGALVTSTTRRSIPDPDQGTSR